MKTNEAFILYVTELHSWLFHVKQLLLSFAMSPSYPSTAVMSTQKNGIYCQMPTCSILSQCHCCRLQQSSIVNRPYTLDSIVRVPSSKNSERKLQNRKTITYAHQVFTKPEKETNQNTSRLILRTLQSESVWQKHVSCQCL